MNMVAFAYNKSLGQHFLRNTEIVHDIVEIAKITSRDIVVEVGPGDGVLTAALATHAGQVIAVEKDARLIATLQKRFANMAHVTIIHDDILHSNVESMIDRATATHGSAYKVVANIPYYITAPILRLFMEQSHPPHMIVVMVQKEVAERLCAAPGQMSVLSVAAQYYCSVHYARTVDRANFEPVPAVDSAIVVLKRRAHVQPDAEFFRIVRIGFSARRKTLVNNLVNGLRLSKHTVTQLLVDNDIAPHVRAQELSVAQWQQLARAVREVHEKIL